MSSPSINYKKLSHKIVMGEMKEGDGLPRELRTELERLEDEFTVDTEQLKRITHRFQEELEEGLEEEGKNIV